MKKILVVFTGGTIGSKKSNKTINVDDSSAYYLLKEYEKSSYTQDVIFDTIQPLNILSENLVPSDWYILFECLSDSIFEKYDGIIITHGTDTLPFTSAALSYRFNYTPIPIVITASNYPLEDQMSNGLRNFINSVDFIVNEKIPGVFVVYENNQGESIVHFGTRLTEAAPFTNEFDGVNSVYWGKMIERRLELNADSLNPTKNMLELQREKVEPVNYHFSTEILYIKPHPGLNYSYYDFSIKKPRAVLHDLYHSGTACTRNSDNHSLIHFTKYCIENGVDIYISPINVSGDLYLTSNDLIDAGSIPLQNISVEAGIVKLMFAYGTFNDKAEITEFLNNKTLFFEFIRKFSSR